MTDLEIPGVNGAEFRELASTFASGVTVVTTLTPDGRPWGFTATSFASVSLDPPLVLVSLDVQADCHPAFQEAQAFAVNILGEGQREVAARFAMKGTDKFSGVENKPGARVTSPLLEGSHAQLECTLFARHAAGDHTILIGRVVAGQRFDRAPLLYHRRAFGRFSSAQ